MNNVFLGLDVGERRIGVARAIGDVRAAWPLITVFVDGSEQQALQKIVHENNVTDIVVGRPLNQAGQPTAQSEAVEAFVEKTVRPLGLPVYWQEESVTSIAAEERLKSRGVPFDRAAIDAEAAAIILQDFLEALK